MSHMRYTDEIYEVLKIGLDIIDGFTVVVDGIENRSIQRRNISKERIQL